jgi:hypothetical protein
MLKQPRVEKENGKKRGKRRLKRPLHLKKRQN